MHNYLNVDENFKGFLQFDRCTASKDVRALFFDFVSYRLSQKLVKRVI